MGTTERSLYANFIERSRERMPRACSPLGARRSTVCPWEKQRHVAGVVGGSGEVDPSSFSSIPRGHNIGYGGGVAGSTGGRAVGGPALVRSPSSPALSFSRSLSAVASAAATHWSPTVKTTLKLPKFYREQIFCVNEFW